MLARIPLFRAPGSNKIASGCQRHQPLAGLLLLLGIATFTRHTLAQVLGLNTLLQGALLILVDAGRVCGRGQREAVQPLVVTALVLIKGQRYHPEGLAASARYSARGAGVNRDVRCSSRSKKRGMRRHKA